MKQSVRAPIYFAAVIRCFPGKAKGGADRVPAPDEIRNCSSWMDDEFEMLRPQLVIPVGRLAITHSFRAKNLTSDRTEVRRSLARVKMDIIPLPHPSGASPWPKLSPGKELLAQAMRKISRHLLPICALRFSLDVFGDQSHGLERARSRDAKTRSWPGFIQTEFMDALPRRSRATRNSQVRTATLDAAGSWPNR